MVSLFAEENGQVLAQLKTDGKGMELAGILKLLGMVDLAGAVVTIDALGCQKEVAQTILDRGGDYLLCVKENQPTLHDALERNLNAMILDAKGSGDAEGLDRHDQTNAGHGRIETRRVWATHQIEWLGVAADWPGLKTVAVVEARRTPDRGKLSKKRKSIKGRRKIAGWDHDFLLGLLTN